MKLGAAVVIALAVAGPARAQMPERLAVAGSGACPAPAAVMRALSRLHPGLRVELGSAGARAEVIDRGAAYEVRAAGATRLLRDPSRRCGERATAAALAVTLLIAPPAVPPEGDDGDGPLATRASPARGATATARDTMAPGSPEEPRPSAPRPAATASAATAPTGSPDAPRATAVRATTSPARASAPAAPATPTAPPSTTPAATATAAPATTTAPSATTSAPPAAPAPGIARRAAAPARRPARLELEATGLVDGAPALGDSASQVTGGAALRFTIGGRSLAFTLGIAGLAPATARTNGVDVRFTRVPVDAALRLALRRSRLELGGDVGLALAVLHLEAPSLANASASDRLDVGARLAPWLRVWITSRLALQAGVSLTISFAPFDLSVDPVGKIGTTPRLWLGGGVGLAARL